jgi:hypothetical protein
MPGPQSKNRKSREDTGTSSKRAAKRLAARVVSFADMLRQSNQSRAYRKPGSENRKK